MGVEYSVPTAAEIGFDLGDTVQDDVSKLQGIALARVDYLSGCVQFEVQPALDKDGKVPESTFVDFQRLRRVGAENYAIEPSRRYPTQNVDYELGNTVRDRVTGFEGIATTRIEGLSGEVRYGVTPRVKDDGKHPSAIYLPSMQLVKVGDGVATPRRPSGGPSDGPQRDRPGY